MPIKQKVNGVWTDLDVPRVKVNNKWRDSNVYAKVNGTWKLIHSYYITERDIVGFKMIYTLNPTKTHPEYPTLKFSNSLPVIFKRTGENIGVMDTSSKGVIYEFYDTLVKEEGINMYEGRLYAVLSNGLIIDACDIVRNRLYGLDIIIQSYELYEDNGYNIFGWNSVFHEGEIVNRNGLPNDDVFDPDEITAETVKYTWDVDGNLPLEPLNDNELSIDKVDDAYHSGGIPQVIASQNEIVEEMVYKIWNGYISSMTSGKHIHADTLQPITNRRVDFQPIAEIGIVRDMSSENNMVGSHGILDQTIEGISVNGVQKPFVIEIL